MNISLKKSVFDQQIDFMEFLAFGPGENYMIEYIFYIDICFID